MAAMASGQQDGAGAALSMLRGGGGQISHELWLKLGSTRAPEGEPRADHFLPRSAQLGKSVPLVTPRQVADEPFLPGQMQMPSGRLLLFWGCGERADPGQPVVIDFSRMARGEIPPGLMAQGIDLPEAWRVDAANSRTFGEWPNERNSRMAPANASLLGDHRITSSYAPEIAFSLAEDFMPALQLGSRDLFSGAVVLSWNGLPQATGYYA